MKKIIAICFAMCLVSLIFSASVLASFDVWKIDVKTKEITRITNQNSEAEFDWTLSPDGSKLVLTEENTLKIYDLTGKMLNSFTLNVASAIDVIDWGADGLAIYASQDTVNMLILDARDFRLKSQAKIGDIAFPLVSPDKRLVAHSADKDGDYYLSILDLKKNEGVDAEETISSGIYIWSPDSKFISVLTDDSDTLVYDVTGKLIQTYTGYMPLAWSPDNKQMLLCSYDTSDMVIVDRKDWSIIKSIPTTLAAFGEWSPDLQSIAYSDCNSDAFDDGMSLWVTELAGNKVRLTNYGEDLIINFKWTPDGKYLLFMHDDIYEQQ